MTTYDDDDTGLDTANPIELYRFYGDLGSYTFTSGNLRASFAAPSATGVEVYEPTPVQRSEIKLGDVTEKNELTITIPRGLQLTKDYVFDIAPCDDLIIEIYRQHPDTGNYRLIFYGVVASFSVQDNKVQVICPSLFTTYLQSEFPNIYFQSNCNHTLFDAKCGLDKDLFKVVAEITYISPDRLTLGFVVVSSPLGNGASGSFGDKTFDGITYNSNDTVEWDNYLNDYPSIVPEASRQVALGNFDTRIDYAAWHYLKYGIGLGYVATPTITPTSHTIMEDGWLVPGKIIDNNEERLILAHASDQIQVSYPFRSMKLGDSVLLYAGCNHTSSQCNSKFNNGSNFLGFEYIPYINPFIVGIK